MLSRISPHLNLTVVRKFASSDKKLPVTRLSDAKLKTFEEFLNETSTSKINEITVHENNEVCFLNCFY